MEKINAEIIEIKEAEEPKKIITKIKRYLYNAFNNILYNVTLKDEKGKTHTIIIDDDELYRLGGYIDKPDIIYGKKVVIGNDDSGEYIVEHEE